MSEKVKVSFEVKEEATLKEFLESLVVNGKISINFISTLLYFSESSEEYFFDGKFEKGFSLRELAPMDIYIGRLIKGEEVFIFGRHQVSPDTVIYRKQESKI